MLPAAGLGSLMIGSEIDPRDFEATFRILEGLTRSEIAELVVKDIAPEDAASFCVLTEGLCDEGLRFLAARALVRLSETRRR